MLRLRRVIRDVQLLKDCDGDDPRALERFSNVSYANEVRDTIVTYVKEQRLPLSSQDIEDLIDDALNRDCRVSAVLGASLV